MNHRPSRDKVVGILYPGEMGSAFGRLLVDAGFKVVTTLEARSPRTAGLSARADLQVLPSFREVVQISDIVVSLVPPSEALGVAKRYSELAHLGAENQVFIDANSISPATAGRINSLITGQRKRFIDAAIQGLASRVATRGVLLLSGAGCQEVADLFAGIIKIRLLGEIPGRASACKLIISGMPKGIVALFLELSAAAEELDLLDEVLAGLRDLYPELMEVMDRLLPTYPTHAGRRSEEIGELEQTLASVGLKPQMVREAGRITADIDGLGLSAEKEFDGWTAQDVIKSVNHHGLFRDKKDQNP
jgi:3-hydroxyisobutyrate dehydrogenase-like beta-hydroxyacid dehydrogenase